METYNFNQSGIKNIPVFCCGVYAIRNNLNGHMYVGSSTNIRSRLQHHLQTLKKNKCCNKTLQHVVNTIGLDKFSILILEKCDNNYNTIKYLENKYIDLYGNYNKNKVSGKPVHCYDMNGNYLTSYNNLIDAARSINGFTDNIRGCCEHRANKKSYKGYQWSYDKVHNIGKWSRKQVYENCKKVQQLTKDNIIISTYMSIGQASRCTGINKSAIQAVLSTKKIHKTAGGYIWKYVEGGKNDKHIVD